MIESEIANLACFLLLFVGVFMIFFQRFHWSLAIALNYTMLRAIVDIYHAHALPGPILILFTQQSLYAILYPVLILGFSFLPRFIAIDILHTLFFVNLGAMLGNYWSSNDVGQGLILNVSMNACLMVVLAPMVQGRILGLVVQAVTIFIVISSGKAAPAAAIITVYSLKFWRRFPTPTGVLALFTTVLSLNFIPYSHITQRLYWYRFFFDHWWNDTRQFFGWGVNHFLVYGPKLQFQFSEPNEIWAHAHSDVFQTLLEAGIFGVALWSLAVFYFLKKIQNQKPLLGSSVALLVTSLFYFPLHSGVFLLVIACLVCLSTKIDDGNII